LSRKLRHLSSEVLQELYSNESFTIPGSEMLKALQLIQPPPRKKLLYHVQQRSEYVDERLLKSAELTRRLHASRVIFHAVMKWYKPIRTQNKLRSVLEEARRREIAHNQKHAEDNLFKY